MRYVDDLDLDSLDVGDLDIDGLDTDDLDHSEIADVDYDGGPIEPEAGHTIDPLDGPDLPHFGESPSGISDDHTQETVSYSDSFKDYFGDVTGRRMTPE